MLKGPVADIPCSGCGGAIRVKMAPGTLRVPPAPKGRNNEAQAEGLGLDYPQILPPALKGRNTSSPIPELPTTSGTCGIEKDCSAPSGLGYRFGLPLTQAVALGFVISPLWGSPAYPSRLILAGFGVRPGRQVPPLHPGALIPRHITVRRLCVQVGFEFPAALWNSGLEGDDRVEHSQQEQTLVILLPTDIVSRRA